MVTCLSPKSVLPSVTTRLAPLTEDTHEVGRSDDLELVGGGRRGSETARVTERLNKRLLNTVYRLLIRGQWGIDGHGLNKSLFNLN